MGISGLLPLLKPIQTQRHLSEFAGQTLAVDAYVWLHRGVYACATDLALGKKTTRYVDYAMHRVRLLLHHSIQPFIVFDGGPLPAKAPTEKARKQRREDSLAKGKDLAKQGKLKEARDYFVKAVDVGTEMAFQLIKALKAEGIPYIVAPYEADAQLAYLERKGVVDGIITEDSDLLVFGCKTVLFKLDAISATVTCISQSDFASVDGSNGSGISLQTFTPSQFRQMCMLSGCDYLPSIPGIGLKTAYTLLRTHKTVENVVKAVRFEGKKNVPKDYIKMFRLAEKAFFYQRVWDPFEGKLVRLTEVPEGEELDEEVDSYVGCDLPQALAKQIAEGAVCPITLQRIKDINPDFAPRTSKRAPLAPARANCSNSKERKAEQKTTTGGNGGLLNYFALRSKEAPAPWKKGPSRGKSSAMIVGRASGKRTLVEVMDLEMEGQRKKKREEDFISDISSTETKKLSNRSRFFDRSASTTTAWTAEGVAGPSRLGPDEGQKENISLEDEYISEEEFAFGEEGGDIEEEVEEESNVAQEDGYISPSHSIRWDTPDLSSPPKPPAGYRRNVAEDDFFATDAISSPIAGRSHSPLLRPSGSPARHQNVKDVRPASSSMASDLVEVSLGGVDLRDAFGDDEDDLTSDAEGQEIPPENSFSSTSSASTSVPVTPDDSGYGLLGTDDVELDFDLDMQEEVARANKIRHEIVANGWWQRWACGPSAEKSAGKQRACLRRAETTITPDGKTVQRKKSKSSAATRPAQSRVESTSAARASEYRTGQPSRKSLAFQEVRRAPAPDFDAPALPGSPEATSAPELPLSEVISRARGRLAEFRLARKDGRPAAAA